VTTDLEQRILDALPNKPQPPREVHPMKTTKRHHRDSPEKSLEKKVRKLEAIRDLRRKQYERDGNEYRTVEANALDFAIAFIEEYWDDAVDLIEERRKEST
jgi:hypothetical protein